METTPENEQYWAAVEQYLARFADSVTTTPDIQANGSDGPVTLAAGGSAALTIGLQTTDTGTEYKDWWVYADTPFGPFSWVYPTGWQAGEARTILFPVVNLNQFTLPPALPLPAGTYTFYFSVDANGDGVRDNTHSDSVQVIFQ